MNSLTDFLLERIAEDEAVAQAAVGSEWFDGLGLPGHVSNTVGDDVAVGNPKTTAHIARHDPARVLADCAAKRAVVELHGPMQFGDEAEEFDEPDLAWCAECTLDSYHRQKSPCRTLKALAQPHADRPDFDEAWRA